MKNFDNSILLNIRLQLAYHDLLQSKVPFITRRFIKRFREAQIDAARRLKGKKKLEVVFFASNPGMWKADSLFRAMQQNPHYHPVVAIGPYSTYKEFSQVEVNKALDRTVDFIKAKGYEYILPYDNKSHRWLDIKPILNPDIVFFDSPYKDHPPIYHIYHFRDCLTCYVPYGFQNFSFLYNTNYNLLFHNLVGCFFHESRLHMQLSAEHSRNNAVNGIVTGYPATEVFLDSNYSPKDLWKPQSGEKKRVIWAPHQSIEEEGTLSMSTFITNCDIMLQLADKFVDTVQIAFKPHQLLKFKLQKVWGEKRVEEYYKQWNARPNTQLEESSYVDLFLTSDAMIHDSGSFTTEYLFTRKPVLFTVRNERVRSNFSPFGEKMFDAHYHAHNPDDIERFLTDVVLGGNDPMATIRQEVFNDYLQPIDGMMPSQRIIFELEKLIANS